jgi:rSAM/selenodomain-associated transferase 1
MRALKRLVVVFLKLPAPGRVKTRLAAGVGDREAAMIYSELVRRTLVALPDDGSCVWLFAEPADRLSEIEAWIRSLGMFPWQSRATMIGQPDGDLGDRLGTAFDRAFDESFDQVVAVGTDCPQLTRAHFAQAWEKLAGTDVVIGPAMDGGYYLIGLRCRAAGLFRGIPWSSPETLEATRRAAAASGLTVSLLDTLRDVDSIDDWEAVRPHLT